MVVQDSGGLGQSKTLSLRGASGNGVLVLLDGVPAQRRRRRGGLLAALPGDHRAHRSPAGRRRRALRQRRPGRGGERGDPRSPGWRAAVRGAHQGSFSTTLAHAAGVTGSLAGGEGLLLLQGARSAGDFTYLRDDLPELADNPLTEAPRENNQSASGGGLLKFRRSWGAATAEASVELSAEQRGLAGTSTNPTVDAHEQTLRGSGTLRTTWALPEGELGARLFARRDDLTLRGGFFGNAYRQLDQGLGLELEGSSLLGERHGLSGSASLAGEWLREPTGANPHWARLSAMACDELLFHQGDWVLAPSLRVDRTGPFTGLSPKLGASARLPWGLGVKGNLGQAHLAPSFLELYVEQGFLMPNPALRPAAGPLRRPGGQPHHPRLGALGGRVREPLRGPDQATSSTHRSARARPTSRRRWCAGSRSKRWFARRGGGR